MSLTQITVTENNKKRRVTEFYSFDFFVLLIVSMFSVKIN